MERDCPIANTAGWPVVRLKDIATKIGSGATPRGGSSSYLERRLNFALVRSQNVFDRQFDPSGLAFISDDQADALRSAQLQSGDILLNITGDGVTFGRACMVPDHVLPACVNQHVSIIRLDPSLADPGYALSFLTHPDIKPYIESFNAGGSRRAITKGHIESFCLPLPKLRDQRAIAYILGTLDDKIELNRRMNETLEAMARALFKSWFVDFDPVRAKAQGQTQGQTPAGLDPATAALFPSDFRDSGSVRVPEGWARCPLGDVLELKRGYDLPKKSRISGTVPIVSSSGPTGFHVKSKADGPGIVTGRYGTIGQVFLVWEDFWPLNTTLYVRDLKDNDLLYCYFLLRGLDFLKFSDKAAVPGINRNHVHEESVLLPPLALQRAFSNLVRQWLSLTRANDEQTRALAEIRDALLPKLLSGELSVRQAERAVEDAV